MQMTCTVCLPFSVWHANDLYCLFIVISMTINDLYCLFIVISMTCKWRVLFVWRYQYDMQMICTVCLSLSVWQQMTYTDNDKQTVRHANDLYCLFIVISMTTNDLYCLFIVISVTCKWFVLFVYRYQCDMQMICTVCLSLSVWHANDLYCLFIVISMTTNDLYCLFLVISMTCKWLVLFVYRYQYDNKHKHTALTS